MQFGKTGDMKYTIHFRDKDVDDTTFIGVERHTAGNGNMYLWAPRIHGRDLPPIKVIPLDEIIDYSAVEETEEIDDSAV